MNRCSGGGFVDFLVSQYASIARYAYKGNLCVTNDGEEDPDTLDECTWTMRWRWLGGRKGNPCIRGRQGGGWEGVRLRDIDKLPVVQLSGLMLS